MDAQVTPETLDRIVHQIPIAAMQLQGAVGHRRPRIGRQAFGHRGKAGLVGRVCRDLDGGGI